MEYVVAAAEDGQRLDAILKKACPDQARAKLQKLIRAGLCRINGEIIIDPAKKLRAGQQMNLEQLPAASSLRPEDGDLPLLWQDEELLICDKPANLTVHPCPSCPENTCVQRLLKRFPQLARQEGQRPGIVHRLDKDTSGLLAVALTEKARLRLSEAFADRKIRKEYLALVYGKPPDSGQCLEPLGRHPASRVKMAVVPESRGGKPAHSSWRTLWSADNGKISLLAVRIFSGRTHQIRVHLAHQGYPILGDKTYAPKDVAAMAPRQMLHAWQLWLNHPVSGAPLHFLSSPPEDFWHAITNLAWNPRRIALTGNPGCGKSAFRKILEEMGIPGVSADAVVAGYYSRQGPVSDWLAIRGHDSLLNMDKSVNKAALLRLMQADEQLRRDFNSFIHSLVREDIESFWKVKQDQSILGLCAEIPLYFECGWQKLFHPKPLSVGIHCDTEERWQRIAAHRGWDMDKIRTIEAWQMPENDKMARCDVVIDNTASLAELRDRASAFLEQLEQERRNYEARLVAHLQALCGATAP